MKRPHRRAAEWPGAASSPTPRVRALGYFEYIRRERARYGLRLLHSIVANI